MAESKTVKPRKCNVCKVVIEVTSAQIKEHASTCKKENQ